jgi:hypothetical protein
MRKLEDCRGASDKWRGMLLDESVLDSNWRIEATIQRVLTIVVKTRFFNNGMKSIVRICF